MNVKCLPGDVRNSLRSGICITSVPQCINELVLNSLDANSTNIAVRVKLSTLQLQVIDNGDGINRANLQLVGNRYMTSKCHTLEDFKKKLKTYGFRGESLASIRDCCKSLNISSRFDDEQTYSITLFKESASEITQIQHRPSKGTTITIENFLNNLPIRKARINDNFDLGDIKKNLECLTLMYPKVVFSLRNDSNKRIIYNNRRAKTVEDALINLLPKVKADHLGQITLSKNHVKISALIYKKSWSNAREKFIFVNKRPVSCPELERIIQEILITISTNKRHTNFLYVLNIRCPPSNVELCFLNGKTLVEFGDFDFIKNCLVKMLKKFVEIDNVSVEKEVCKEVSNQEVDAKYRLSLIGDMFTGEAEKKQIIEKPNFEKFFNIQNDIISKTRPKKGDFLDRNLKECDNNSEMFINDVLRDNMRSEKRNSFIESSISSIKNNSLKKNSIRSNSNRNTSIRTNSNRRDSIGNSMIVEENNEGLTQFHSDVNGKFPMDDVVFFEENSHKRQSNSEQAFEPVESIQCEDQFYIPPTADFDAFTFSGDFNINQPSYGNRDTRVDFDHEPYAYKPDFDNFTFSNENVKKSRKLNKNTEYFNNFGNNDYFNLHNNNNFPYVPTKNVESKNVRSHPHKPFRDYFETIQPVNEFDLNINVLGLTQAEDFTVVNHEGTLKPNFRKLDENNFDFQMDHINLHNNYNDKYCEGLNYVDRKNLHNNYNDKYCEGFNYVDRKNRKHRVVEETLIQPPPNFRMNKRGNFTVILPHDETTKDFNFLNPNQHNTNKPKPNFQVNDFGNFTVILPNEETSVPVQRDFMPSKRRREYARRAVYQCNHDENITLMPAEVAQDNRFHKDLLQFTEPKRQRYDLKQNEETDVADETTGKAIIMGKFLNSHFLCKRPNFKNKRKRMLDMNISIRTVNTRTIFRDANFGFEHGNTTFKIDFKFNEVDLNTENLDTFKFNFLRLKQLFRIHDEPQPVLKNNRHVDKSRNHKLNVAYIKNNGFTNNNISRHESRFSRLNHSKKKLVKIGNNNILLGRKNLRLHKERRNSNLNKKTHTSIDECQIQNNKRSINELRLVKHINNPKQIKFSSMDKDEIIKKTNDPKLSHLTRKSLDNNFQENNVLSQIEKLPVNQSTKFFNNIEFTSTPLDSIHAIHQQDESKNQISNGSKDTNVHKREKTVNNENIQETECFKLSKLKRQIITNYETKPSASKLAKNNQFSGTPMDTNIEYHLQEVGSKKDAKIFNTIFKMTGNYKKANEIVFSATGKDIDIDKVENQICPDVCDFIEQSYSIENSDDKKHIIENSTANKDSQDSISSRILKTHTCVENFLKSDKNSSKKCSTSLNSSIKSNDAKVKLNQQNKSAIVSKKKRTEDFSGNKIKVLSNVLIQGGCSPTLENNNNLHKQEMKLISFPVVTQTVSDVNCSITSKYFKAPSSTNDCTNNAQTLRSNSKLQNEIDGYHAGFKSRLNEQFINCSDSNSDLKFRSTDGNNVSHKHKDEKENISNYTLKCNTNYKTQNTKTEESMINDDLENEICPEFCDFIEQSYLVGAENNNIIGYSDSNKDCPSIPSRFFKNDDLNNTHLDIIQNINQRICERVKSDTYIKSPNFIQKKSPRKNNTINLNPQKQSKQTKKEPSPMMEKSNGVHDNEIPDLNNSISSIFYKDSYFTSNQVNGTSILESSNVNNGCQFLSPEYSNYSDSNTFFKNIEFTSTPMDAITPMTKFVSKTMNENLRNEILIHDLKSSQELQMDNKPEMNKYAELEKDSLESFNDFFNCFLSSKFFKSADLMSGSADLINEDKNNSWKSIQLQNVSLKDILKPTVKDIIKNDECVIDTNDKLGCNVAEAILESEICSNNEMNDVSPIANASQIDVSLLINKEIAKDSESDLVFSLSQKQNLPTICNGLNGILAAQDKEDLLNNFSEREIDQTWESIETKNNVFYYNKKTGFSTVNDPRDTKDFLFKTRSNLLPKGLSPMSKSLHILEDPLSASGKEHLQTEIMKSYEDELETIKWKKIMMDPMNPIAFFKAIYKERCKKLKDLEFSVPDLHNYARINDSMQFDKDIFADLRVLGQLDSKFIVTLVKSRNLILLFDQHAVHERIRVEKLYFEYGVSRNLYKKTDLIDSLIVPLHECDIRLMKEFVKLFESLGLTYDLKTYGVSVKTVPTCLYNKSNKRNSNENNLNDLVTCLIDEELQILKGTRNMCNVPKVIQTIVNSEACRGAIMFGDMLQTPKCVQLLSELSTCNLPFQCAHGRPTLSPIIELKDIVKNVNKRVNLQNLKNR